MNHRIALARFTFSLDAVLGMLVVGIACLFGAAYNRHADVWTMMLTVFVPLSAVWALLCYGAYRGLTSGNVVLRFVFWFFVVCNAITFPIGTAIAGVSIWLWRDFRAQDGRADSDKPRSA